MDTGILTQNLKANGFSNKDVAEWIGVTPSTVVLKIRGISFFTEEEIEIISERMEMTQKERCKIFGTMAERKQRQKDLSLSSQLKKVTGSGAGAKQKKDRIKKSDKSADRLREIIKGNGDTIMALSHVLGISRETLSRKISGAQNGSYKTGFSAKEISIISDRYSMSRGDQVLIFGEADAAAGAAFAKDIPMSTIKDSGPHKNRPADIIATNETTGTVLQFNTIVRTAEYIGATLAEVTNRLAGSTKKDYVIGRNGERWKVHYAGQIEPTKESVNEKGAEIE